MDVKVSIEQTSEVDRSVNIEIPRALYQQKFDKMLNKTVPSVELRGFRKGRAPRAMVAKLYGEKIRSEVLGELIHSAYSNAVDEHDLKVVSDPDVKIDEPEGEDDQDFKVTASVSVYPEPEIKDYLGLSLEVEVSEVPEGELERRLMGIREQGSKLEPKEGAAVSNGDVAKIEYVATVDGEELNRSKEDGEYIEIGSGKAFEDIEKALIGLKADGECQVDVVLPENAGEELQGKTAQYAVKLIGVFEKQMPELDDALAAMTGLAETVDELKQYIEKQIADEVVDANKREREEKLFTAVLEKNDFKVPQAMIDSEIKNFLIQMNVLTRENRNSIDVTPFRGGLGVEAEKRVKTSVAFSRIVEIEEIAAEEQEVEEWLAKKAVELDRKREEIDKMYGFPNNKSHVESLVIQEKLIDKLLSSATVKEVAKPKEKEAE